MGKHLVKVTGFRIPEETLNELNIIAEEKNIVRNQLVNEILNEYIKYYKLNKSLHGLKRRRNPTRLKNAYTGTYIKEHSQKTN